MRFSLKASSESAREREKEVVLDIVVEGEIES